MSDEILDSLERTEKQCFARVVFIAKIVTWAALLLLAGIIEAGIIVKVFQVEFSGSAQTASSLLKNAGLCSPQTAAALATKRR